MELLLVPFTWIRKEKFTPKVQANSSDPMCQTGDEREMHGLKYSGNGIVQQ